MSAISQTPTNLNYLSSLGFQLVINKCPNVNFFIQEVNLPALTLSPTPEMPNPFVAIPYPGEHLIYEPLRLTFKVDENLQNYLEIHNWLQALGKPQDFYQFKELNDQPIQAANGVYSDISILMMSGIKNPNYQVTYVDAFPVSISELVFKTTPGDIQYLEATTFFRYTYYDISVVT